MLSSDLSFQKALNQLNDDVRGLPLSVSEVDVWYMIMTNGSIKIILECAAALVAFILGTTLSSAPLKEITWASEMSKRYALPVPVRDNE